jgi:Zn-dependent peptidase ImmA (M78 family)
MTTDFLKETEESEIIKRFQSSPPVDVGSVAEALGLKVWESSTLPEDVSGKIIRDDINGGPAKYSILVNSSQSYARKRFTVAHEVAHYVLHRDLIGSGLTDDALYRSGLATSKEAQANRLAAEILMPDHLLAQGRVFTENPDFLAKRYQVSGQAMRIRLGLPAEFQLPSRPSASKIKADY